MTKIQSNSANILELQPLKENKKVATKVETEVAKPVEQAKDKIEFHIKKGAVPTDKEPLSFGTDLKVKRGVVPAVKGGLVSAIPAALGSLAISIGINHPEELAVKVAKSNTAAFAVGTIVSGAVAANVTSDEVVGFGLGIVTGAAAGGLTGMVSGQGLRGMIVGAIGGSVGGSVGSHVRSIMEEKAEAKLNSKIQ